MERKNTTFIVAGIATICALFLIPVLISSCGGGGGGNALPYMPPELKRECTNGPTASRAANASGAMSYEAVNCLQIHEQGEQIPILKDASITVMGGATKTLETVVYDYQCSNLTSSFSGDLSWSVSSASIGSITYSGNSAIFSAATSTTALSGSITASLLNGGSVIKQDSITVTIPSTMVVTASASPTSALLSSGSATSTITCIVAGGTATSLEVRCDSTDSWSALTSGDSTTCTYTSTGTYSPACRADGSLIDACDTPVTIGSPVCGNAIVETGEDCDDGNTTTETCTYGESSCTVCDATCSSVAGATSYCGDSVIDAANGETCDDGPMNYTANNCNNTCDGITPSVCGNLIVEAGEDCDDGDLFFTDACPSCVNAACGDGYRYSGVEACDDGNTTDGDGCTSSCEIAWAATFGGTGGEQMGSMSAQETDDRGFILSGYTTSTGAGGLDFWVVKVDEDGNETWSNTYGGTGNEYALSILPTSDSGYIIAGKTDSVGAGGDDFWVVKIDSSGGQMWAYPYGGTGNESAFAIQETTDGGYIVAGTTSSYGAGSNDFWVVKLDVGGNQTWANAYGGTGYDDAYAIIQTSDGGYAVTGLTDSVGSGGYDVWVVKLDSAGNQTWANAYGGTGQDIAQSIQQTSDGGYIVAGNTSSFGVGGDFWVLKLDSAGNQTWANTYGDTGNESAWAVQQTTDGGYIVAGSTDSAGAGMDDFWLVKLDPSGTELWNKTHGGTGTDIALTVVESTNGGYMLSGDTDSFGSGGNDFWVVKTDPDGNCPSCY